MTPLNILRIKPHIANKDIALKIQSIFNKYDPIGVDLDDEYDTDAITFCYMVERGMFWSYAFTDGHFRFGLESS